ncbi:hypothetical protein M436DRAFT_39688 [Aureobasidium namibiae CBS 147.97]|uniref:F-box domain-containing protein n=1 Tax=Aureobasidium namibiae CBS 147.97 TaxID=1043004 RepID=A0A074WSU0_9PEZI|nr:uncharacterized protein M436DRAFT_39688 [Aureobasidium namibiae CBS 147.97]KEQ76193.1 hypothetical protein M436DRAFT_39688 [Aureobasidium namibiae CBS 147.97]
MSTRRRPELVVLDGRPSLTPLNQLLAENMLKTTRLYVRRRTRQSAQLLARKSISYWLDQKQPRSMDSTSTHANSACDRLFAVQELADAIFAHLDFHDTSCCLAVSRTIRHAAQQTNASVRLKMPLVECEDHHLLYMEKQLDLSTSTSDWQRQRFFMNSGTVVFPKNAPAPLLISMYDIMNTIGEPCRRRVTVDMWFSATGHTPKDFTLDGSWLNLALPLPDIVVWIVSISCDCHRTDSFCDKLDSDQSVGRRAYKKGTSLVFPYKLVTENGDHLRQIAKYSRKAYRMHRHCRNDHGDAPSGLSSITFKALKRNQAGFDLLDTSTHSTRPSPKHRADPFSTTSPQEKTRRETLLDIGQELAPKQSMKWSLMMRRILSREKLFRENIPPEEFLYTLEKLGRLSTWDRFMGRTEVKLGY